MEVLVIDRPERAPGGGVPEAQRAVGRGGRERAAVRREGEGDKLRTVAAEFAERFPAPDTLWTIDDLGGWGVVDPELFAKDTGKIAVIYDEATS